jgi:hypothetical protein
MTRPMSHSGPRLHLVALAKLQGMVAAARELRGDLFGVEKDLYGLTEARHYKRTDP